MTDENQRKKAAFTTGVDPTLRGYAIVSVIGRGGFAVVYKARQPAFNRLVAIKVLSRQDLDGRSYRLFERERIALGALSSHPNIVTVYDSGVTDEGAPFLVMEYVTRGSLADWMNRGPFPWQEAVGIGIKLVGALEAAHRAGVLHRDIKPENVLMSAFGEPQLADFGIVRLLGTPQTRSLEVNLSVPYAPPEILDGDEPSVRSDVYSVACTVHSLMWGRPSFLSQHQSQNSLVPLMVRIHGDAPPDLRPSGVPPAVCSALERAMAKAPNERPATALDLGTALQAAQVTAGLSPTPLPLAEPTITDAPERASPGRRIGETTVRFPAMLSLSALRIPRRRLRRTGSIAVVAVLLVIAALASLASRPGTGGTGPDTTTMSAPPTSPSTTVEVPKALPQNIAPLPEGLYFLVGFRPMPQFRLGGGWRRLRADRADLVELVRTGGPEDSLVSFFSVDRLVVPGRAFSSLAEAKRPDAGIAAPDDVVGWLVGHPRLSVSPPVPVRAGAHSGQRLDLDVKAQNAVCTRSRTPCTVLFQFEKTVFVLLAGNRNRFYVFDTGNSKIVISVEAAPEQFEELAAETEHLMSSLGFRSP